MMTPLLTEAREVVGTIVGGGETLAVTIGGVVTTVTVASATTVTIAAAPPLQLRWSLSGATWNIS